MREPRRPRHDRRSGQLRAGVAAACAIASIVTANVARADDPMLSPPELARLRRGEVVTRPDTIVSDDREWIGGVSWVVLDARPEQVADALEQVGDYDRFLPKTRSARFIAMSRDGDAIVELEQGTSLVHGRYTVRVHRDHEAVASGDEIVRFALDPRYPHDIDDARGWFRMEPFDRGRTLMTYVVLVDLGPGLFKRIFEERIRAVALSTPVLVRSFVESRGDGSTMARR
jgi:hypothetical protein